MARPLADVDPEKVRLLAEAGCSTPEIAAMLGVSRSTIERRFGEALKRGAEAGCGKIRFQQHKAAMNGNTRMLVWLGKQRLGQRDAIDQNVNVSGSLCLLDGAVIHRDHDSDSDQT